ncbi:GNAT family N-acetyltransferase [Paenibacillus sp. GCM10012307]|uniref:GNAT family N-acetyltransferase n=1 Tax=Paenibacillus roseus TaxID=2798579 RepID=A0A934J616_9BACL|nr:GNAT family N-acetyltransferase [Paenibacillus roseus]MBJ6360973.1 GNAT family N-acetyltransferase [Paenibacillus roseus]
MIRPAEIKDSKEIAGLIYEIWEGMDLFVLNHYSREVITEGLSEAVADQDNKFSHRNVLVKEQEGRVAGIVIAYDGSREFELHDRLIAILRRCFLRESFESDREADRGEWYIDMLCVDKSNRGQGIGTKLLEAAETYGAKKGFAIVSLNVEQDNSGARRLYEALGYQEIKQIMIADHEYAHMVKPSGCATGA